MKTVLGAIVVIATVGIGGSFLGKREAGVMEPQASYFLLKSSSISSAGAGIGTLQFAGGAEQRALQPRRNLPALSFSLMYHWCNSALGNRVG